MEAKNAEAKVSDQHPELHHYTGWVGLEGIIRSQSLWSVRYDRMNDPTEMEYAKQFIRDQLSVPMRDNLRRRRLKSSRLDRRIKELGGINEVVRLEGERWIDIHYLASKTAGENHDVPFAIPHITSFCSHSGDHEYERDNGLLSQWRGYGKEGAFAIVLDTLQLEYLVASELERWDYITAQLFDVVYDREPEAATAQFSEVINLMADNWVRDLDREKGSLEDLFPLFVRLTCRLKHRGFFEEREVRLVTYPVYAKYREYRQNRADFNSDEALKPIKPMIEAEPKPHVALFDRSDRKLPIRRIIVGPSADQAREIDRVRQLVGTSVQITRSETPYLPNG
jgi:hypothetical protein